MLPAHCFTYGSLMFAEVMFAVAAQTGLRAVPATLDGWQRFRIREVTYPAALRSRHASRIEGMLWFDLSDEAWKRLDAFEGEVYNRVEVEVESDSGRHRAWIYEYLKPDRVLAEDWDPKTFQQQHMADFFRQHGAHLLSSAD